MNSTNYSNVKKRKKAHQSPEAMFQFELNSCSKNKDLRGAIALYESAISQKIRINQHHFNSLLYLCSNSVTDASLKDLSLDYGIHVFDHMLALGINPNEASITTVAGIAVAKGDGDYAFELVKNKAYEVEKEMGAVGISLEEKELAALLKVSAKKGRAERVYEYLHKLRSSERCVSESTARIIEDWFQRTETSEIGELNFDARQVKDRIGRNGGGWHGQGWIGKGNWAVRKTNSVAALAMEREVKENFSEFQGWLEEHADFEDIVGRANVGLFQQNFAVGGFSISQLDDVVRKLYDRNKNKWPLLIMHNKRIRALIENQSSRKLVEGWRDNGALYTTPSGSNDDW
ncbi:hypothetical protein K1719_020212 [Acacia pycnantha]|nr:hypothetical protein K1719_020212 [Acacia pycnantha]